MRRPVLAALFAATALPALAEYPTGPVQFVVPWPPGDLEDVLTRMIADDFQAINIGELRDLHVKKC